MRILPDIQYDFDDVMFLPQLTDPAKDLNSRKDVSVVRKFKPGANRTHSWKGVPIIAANMDTIGTFEMAEALMAQGCCTALHKHYSVDELMAFYRKHEGNTDLIFYTMGISDKDIQRFALFTAKHGIPENICIDVANGYSERFATIVEQIRNKYEELIIIAGNVVTGEMTEELILSGADIVKVGIGPGSVCTTRIKTGVGYPQLSAIIECADAAHGLGGHIIADGGCSSSGDVAKAFGAGADFVMLGGMMAGHDEGGGEVIDGNVQFYGMSSDTANTKHFGGLKEYRSSEGRTVKIPYKGAIKDTVQDILGGIRSACTYAGARKLKDLSKCTTFVRVSQQVNSFFV